MKVVILAGGFGSRIAEETTLKPKPMIEIGGMPIMWHIMKEYYHYGYDEFVICAGYMQSYIKDWFSRYFCRNCDITFDFSQKKEIVTIHKSYVDPWKITIVDTGLNTMTGGRIKRVKDYIGNEPFFMTYGDGVCDVDINKLLEFHQSHGKIATLTAVNKPQDKGTLVIGNDDCVAEFKEKKVQDRQLINGGYMVLEPQIFDYIDGDDTIFEKTPLESLTRKGELASYHHNGFWQCMDNIHERELLNNLILENRAPWMKWR